jgi:uncharacterized membrane protein YcfT
MTSLQWTTPTPSPSPQGGGESRIGFVDYGKGFCIILVVMMHSVLGTEAAAGHAGWLHAAVEFARPFRIPSFFLIAGLFLSRSIDSDWRSYLDRKVLHFVYFYVLWLTIQFAFKFPSIAHAQGMGPAIWSYLEAFVQPFGTLWFIYLLPIFFVVTKLTRPLPPLLVWIAAAALEIAPIETGSVVIDEFAARFVYFYSGYLLARPVFAFSDETAARPALAIAGLLAWSIFNGLLVAYGWAERPFVSLMLGMIGSAALIAASALLARRDLLPPLRLCGQNSLIIYLAFFLPMVIAREILVRSGVMTDVGTMSLIVTVAAVIVPLMIERLVRHTRLRFLFERPASFRLKPDMRLAPQR